VSTVTDAFGRTVTIETDVGGLDLYAVNGVTLEFPTGTSQSSALATINSMAPESYAAPVTSISFLSFFTLFTPTEQTAILTACATDPIIMGLCLQAASAGGSIILNDPRVVAGVTYLTTTTPPILTSDNAALILSGQPSL
jgi:hypothetical protein